MRELSMKAGQGRPGALLLQHIFLTSYVATLNFLFHHFLLVEPLYEQVVDMAAPHS